MVEDIEVLKDNTPKQKMDPKITVDHREHAQELITELRARYGFSIELKQLKLGDYYIPPDTIVERKTVHDFGVSILDGRLFQQAYRLVEHANNAILLIEGSSFNLAKPHIKIASIKGAMITLAQTFRLPVLRSKDVADSAWYLYHL